MTKLVIKRLGDRRRIGIKLVFGKEIVNVYTSQIGLEEQEKRFLGNMDVIVHSIREKKLL